jgi:hypothetical protein
MGTGGSMSAHTITEFVPGMKVKSADDPEPGIVDRIDESDATVWVRFKVRGDYEHPNCLCEVDPADLEILQ